MYTRRARPKRKRPGTKIDESQNLKTQSPSRCQCVPNCTNPPLSGKSPFCAVHAKKCTIRSPLSGWEPIYMPSLYNGTKDIQHNHNCFAYAFDVMDPPTDCTGDACKKPFHQPGYAAGYGKIGEKKFCAELLSRLKGDMPWIKITKFITPCKPGYSKIAIVIDPNNDYHFYRQDSNGFWSHKPGGQPVTNLDASNKLIYNPEFCNRDYRTPGSTDPEELNYSIFCSFLEVPRNRPVHAKRGGGFILGDASSMKGGATRKLRVKKTLKGGVKKPGERRGVFTQTPRRKLSVHRFSMKHSLPTGPNIRNSNMRSVTARRFPIRERRPTTRYIGSQTATHTHRNGNVTPPMKLTKEMESQIRTQFPGEESKKVRRHLFSHPEDIELYIKRKQEKDTIDNIVSSINPTSKVHIQSLFPGEDDRSVKIRHALYVKLGGKEKQSFDDFVTQFMGIGFN
jgi:hypothetical protein